MMDRLRGCLSGYGGPVFPTKADRIMSRYRPIAPKPALPCISDVERSVSSAVTLECIRQVPEAATAMTPKQKSKRVRKRSSKDFEGQLNPTKRPALEALTSQANEKLQSVKGMSYGLATEATPMLIQEDAGFMERAAASAPSSMFPLDKTRKVVQSSNYGYGGCFTELIRGIAGLPTANHVYNLLQHQQQQPQAPNFLNVLPEQPSIGQPVEQQQGESYIQCKVRESKDSVKDELCSDAFWSCFSEGDMRQNAYARAASEEAQQSGLDEEGIVDENDQREGIVTLSLLPEEPTRGLGSRVESPTLSTSSSDSSHTSTYGTTLACIEQVYGHSSEPVMLTDDASHMLLWVNQAYSKACKGNLNMLAPFIDPLGVPTQLGQFQLQLEGQGECSSATLWGFLKKFVVDMANRNPPRWLPPQVMAPPNNAKVESTFGLPAFPHGHGVSKHVSSSPLHAPKVITPQPIRLVGSMVSLESVSETQNGDALIGTLELVKQQLEEGNLPGFITDASNVVRWVNSAYKVMVGQPECPWLASTMKEGGGGFSPTITGEVFLSCNVEVPRLAASFSGRVNVQWTRNTGERSCMTLPCDVSAYVDSYFKRMWLWRFDIQASLSLTCGAERFA